MIVMLLVSGFAGFCVYSNTVNRPSKREFQGKSWYCIVYSLNEEFFGGMLLLSWFALIRQVPLYCERRGRGNGREFHKQLKCHDKDTLKFMIVPISSFVLLQIFGAVVYCTLDEGNTVRQPVLDPLYRFLSLPFLIYFV